MELEWEEYARDIDIIPAANPVEFHKAQLAVAIKTNAVKKLKRLIDSKGGIDLVDARKCTLLHYAVKCHNIEALTVLLTIEGAPINAKIPYHNNEGDICETTVLLSALQESSETGSQSEAMTLKLIEKGADVNVVDGAGTSPLHIAISRHFSAAAEMLIKKGADINRRNNLGATPLVTALECYRIDVVCMLVYYGVDVTISGDPLALASNYEIQDLLFTYLFDEPRFSGSYCALVKHVNDLLESFILGSTCPHWKEFTTQTLRQKFYKRKFDTKMHDMLLMNPLYFKIFVDKFERVAREMISHSGILSELLKAANHTAMENMKILLKSNLASAVIDDINTAARSSRVIYGGHMTIGTFVYTLPEVFVDYFDKKSDAAMLEITSEFLSKGAELDPSSICLVYRIYGFNPLFRQVAAMKSAEEKSKELNDVMPRLIIDVQSTLEGLLEEGLSDYLYSTVDHFCHQQLKQICSQMKDATITEKVDKLPRVPLLAELARNVARSHIVNSYKVATYRELSEVLDRLPIPKEIGRIITYEKALYN